MHVITIKQNAAGLFDVLVNGFSYRIHRNMVEQAARERAADIKAEFQKMKQRAVIECAEA